jgi:hypothetical protein
LKIEHQEWKAKVEELGQKDHERMLKKKKNGTCKVSGTP